MAESFKDWATVQSDLADNTARSITARKVRDGLNSFRAFGGLLVVGGTTPTGASATPTAITLWTSVDANGTGVTANTTTGLTVEAAGLYELTYNLAFGVSSAASEYQLGILKNSEPTFTTGTKQVYLTASNTTYGPVVGHTILNLAAGDILRLAVSVNTGTPTVTPKEGALYVHRIA
jgi:hypothetical protein